MHTDSGLQVGPLGGVGVNAGFVDELMIWGYPRNHEEAGVFMYASASGDEHGLLAYFKFDEVRTSVPKHVLPSMRPAILVCFV